MNPGLGRIIVEVAKGGGPKIRPVPPEDIAAYKRMMIERVVIPMMERHRVNAQAIENMRHRLIDSGVLQHDSERK